MTRRPAVTCSGTRCWCPKRRARLTRTRLHGATRSVTATPAGLDPCRDEQCIAGGAAGTALAWGVGWVWRHFVGSEDDDADQRQSAPPIPPVGTVAEPRGITGWLRVADWRSGGETAVVTKGESVDEDATGSAVLVGYSIASCPNCLIQVKELNNGGFSVRAWNQAARRQIHEGAMRYYAGIAQATSDYWNRYFATPNPPSFGCPSAGLVPFSVVEARRAAIRQNLTYLTGKDGNSFSSGHRRGFVGRCDAGVCKRTGSSF